MKPPEGSVLSIIWRLYIAAAAFDLPLGIIMRVAVWPRAWVWSQVHQGLSSTDSL